MRQHSAGECGVAAPATTRPNDEIEVCLPRAKRGWTRGKRSRGDRFIRRHSLPQPCSDRTRPHPRPNIPNPGDDRFPRVEGDPRAVRGSLSRLAPRVLAPSPMSSGRSQEFREQSKREHHDLDEEPIKETAAGHRNTCRLAGACKMSARSAGGGDCREDERQSPTRWNGRARIASSGAAPLES